MDRHTSHSQVSRSPDIGPFVMNQSVKDFMFTKYYGLGVLLFLFSWFGVLSCAAPQNHNQKNTKERVIENKKIDPEEIQELGLRAPSLQELKLENCSNLNTEFTGSIEPFKNLRKLKLINCEISAKNLGLILQAAPQIDQLVLQNKASGEILWDEKAFWKEFINDTRAQKGIHQLKTLSLSEDFNKKYPLAFNIIIQSKKLKNLYFRNGYSVSGLAQHQQRLGFWNAKNKKLTFIADSSAPIITSDLRKTLESSAEEIKQLCLENIDSLNLFTENNHNLLFQTLELSKCSISKYSSQKEFLEKTPNLTELILEQTSAEQLFTQENKDHLKKITKLTLNTHPKITAECLSKWLAMTPNLTHLTISNCENIEHKELQNLPELNDLEYLNLSASAFSQEQIKALLEKTPNIKKLILKHHQNILQLPLQKLTKLEYLDMSYTNLTLEDLIKWNNARIKGEQDSLNQNIRVRMQGIQGFPFLLTGTFTTAAMLQQKIELVQESQKLSNRLKSSCYNILLDKRTIALATIATGLGVLYGVTETKRALKKLLAAPTPTKKIAPTIQANIATKTLKI